MRAVKAMHARMHELLASTYNMHTPNPLMGHYAGLFEAGGQKLSIHCDGVGSKILVAEAIGRHVLGAREHPHHLDGRARQDVASQHRLSRFGRDHDVADIFKHSASSQANAPAHGCQPAVIIGREVLLPGGQRVRVLPNIAADADGDPG